MAEAKTLVQTKSGTRMVAAEGFESVFDFPEPPWTEDAKSSKCADCGSAFGLLVRKHHCRFCGKIFCGKCCVADQASIRQGFVDPVRLCQHCTPIVKRDNDFMAKYLPVLTAGASFVLAGESDKPVVCRVEKRTHKHIAFANDRQPVALRSITKVEDIAGASASHINGINLSFRESGEEKCLSFLLEGIPERKKSMQWIGALKKALQALHGPNPNNPRRK